MSHNKSVEEVLNSVLTSIEAHLQTISEDHLGCEVRLGPSTEKPPSHNSIYRRVP